MSDAIYHLKPYLLIGGGVIAMFTGPNYLAIGGGVVLVFLGSRIMKWRRGS